MSGADRPIAELEAVHRAGQRLQRVIEPDELAASVIEALEQTIGYRYGAVLLVEPATGRLLPIAVSRQGADEGFAQQDRAFIDAHEPRIGVGVVGWVAEQGRTALIGDVAGDPRYLAYRTDVRSELCVPILADGAVLGVVNVESERSDAFSAADVRVLEAIAAQMSVAIQNTRLVEQLRTAAAELERRVAERTAELRDTNEQLELFASSVSHDIRAPLRAIRGMVGALLEDHGAEFTPEARALAERVVAAGARMDAYIDDLLAYSRVTRSALRLEEVDLGDVLADALDDLGPAIVERGARIEVSRPLPVVIGDRAIVSQAVRNLLSNALRFVPAGRRPEVAIHAGRVAHERVRLNLDDNGIGVDPEDRQRIFGMFERLHGADAYPGTGIGLAIVKRGIDRMGGEAGVTSRDDDGSRFWIELPAAKGAR